MFKFLNCLGDDSKGIFYIQSSFCHALQLNASIMFPFQNSSRELTFQSRKVKVIPPSVYRCRKKFKEEIALLVYKAKRKTYSDLAAWPGSVFCLA